MWIKTDKIPVKIQLLEGGIMPQKKSKQAGAFDVYCPEDTPIRQGRQIIPLRFRMEMPPYLKADMRPRSGYSSRGFELCYLSRDNIRYSCWVEADITLGLVDSDYRDEVGAILNVHKLPGLANDYYIPKGERIAQMAFTYVPDVVLGEVDKLDMTDDRGGGFGHTNK